MTDDVTPLRATEGGPVPTRVLIVSDLHLRPGDDPGPGPGSRRRPHRRSDAAPGTGRDEAFARFAEMVARDAAARDAAAGDAAVGERATRLVLLGDTLDLPDEAPRVERGSDRDPETVARAWSEAAVAELGRIAHTRPAFFDGLRVILGAGVAVDVVAGNHDVAMAFEPVQAAFGELVGGPWPAPAFHQWFLHVPGLVYAEHGHQHHDLNAFPTVLRPELGAHLGVGPLGPRVEAFGRRSADAGLLGTVRAGAGLALDVVRHAAADRRRSAIRSAYRRDWLPAHAATVGLPAAVLDAIDRQGEAGSLATARRIGRQALVSRWRRRPGASGPLAATEANPDGAGYLEPAVRAIDAALSTAGAGVPVYAFGHTHAPAIGPLGAADGASRSALYVNAGSWAGVRPASLARRLGARHLTVASVVADDPDPPVVELLVWDDVLHELVPFDDRG